MRSGGQFPENRSMPSGGPLPGHKISRESLHTFGWTAVRGPMPKSPVPVAYFPSAPPLHALASPCLATQIAWRRFPTPENAVFPVLEKPWGGVCQARTYGSVCADLAAMKFTNETFPYYRVMIKPSCWAVIQESQMEKMSMRMLALTATWRTKQRTQTTVNTVLSRLAARGL